MVFPPVFAGVDAHFPKFGANLLILAGLSSGLYLGFKWPEPKA
ncbi:hypothetical protein GGD83_001015 [Rhodoblastus sphagnicola]|nr:hypothetical protein [Rhodoblastus sphagnicola]MBB4197229.1 hypothetical protein [Rhodoblastus sphagnicola]